MLEMGRKRLYGVNRGFDTTSGFALEIANTSRAWFDFDKAIIDRFDGLAIFREELASSQCFEGSVNGIHFRSALCGYEGADVVTAAMILELFGFGEREEILRTIEVGGDAAHYEFTRPRSPSPVG